MLNRQTGRTSLLFKIITMFLCVILPAYSALTISYNRMNDILRGSILESTRLQAMNALNMLQGDLMQIANLHKEYINDMDLQSFGIGNQLFSPEEQQRIISRLRARLLRIKDSSPYMLDTSVYLFSMRLLIHSNTLQYADTPFDLGELHSRRDLSSPRIMRVGDAFFLLTIYPDYAVNTQPTFLVFTRLAPNDLERFINGLALYENASAVLSTRENDILCANAAWEETGSAAQHVQEWALSGDVHELVRGGYFRVTNVEEKLGLMLSVYFPEHVAMGDVDRLRLINYTILVAVFLLSVAFCFMIYRNVHKPLSVLQRAFDDVASGDAHVRISYDRNRDFHVVYERFNQMVEKLHELIARIYRQEIESKRSELKQLQSQINPHFLYNSFFIIYRLAKMEDTETLSQFAHHLGEYYRYVTRNQSDEVTLADEVRHAKDYIHVQNTRFSNRIDVDFQALDARFEGLPVPRLILQPILENCYEHGFSGGVRCGASFASRLNSWMKCWLFVS